MSNVTVRIPTPLRSFVGGADEVAVSADTVAGVLVVLGERHRGLIERVCDANGKPRPFVNLYLGPKNIKALSGLDTALTDGDVLSIVPAVAGG
jgi:molybdopterin converting factor small subunit